MLPPAIAQDLQCFLRVLHSRYGEDLVSVVLFGSWARGAARAESDIDLLVISKHFPRSRLDRHRDTFEAVKAVTKDFALKVSVIPLTPEEARETKPFYLDVHFVNPLPVMQRPAYRVWAETRHGRIVEAAS